MDATSEVKQGEILAGKYRIEQVLGQGGMGVVVAARHLHLDEYVAIKFLLPDALRSEEAVARFAREARAAVKIKSEHVARVTDVGTLESGSPYMVMEYLDGRDLGMIVQESGALPVELAVDHVLQACEAIAEAHSLGIIHRDLKPANLFLVHRADGSPCVKVLDFGISKLTKGGSTGPDLSMTKTTAVMGSPLYMSPEQMASSRNVDPRSDIWALGAILHELLSGQVPFMADTMPQLCAMILQSPPPALRSLRSDIPEGLEAAILRCLEKDPGARFGNVAELCVALVPFGSRSSRLSTERVSRLLSAAGFATADPGSIASSAPQRPPGEETQAAWGKTRPPRRARGPFIAAAIALLVVGVGAASLIAVGSRAGGSPDPSPTQLAEPEPPAPPAAPVAARPPEPKTAPKPEPAPRDQDAPDKGEAPKDGAAPLVEPAPKPAPKAPKAASRVRSAPKPAEPPAPPPPASTAAPKKPVSKPSYDLYGDRK